MLIPILTTLALAELSARDDARQIASHIDIDHAMQWYIRALVVFGVCLASSHVDRSILLQWHWPESAYALCRIFVMSIGLAGLFSAVFRWRLNRLRGKDWRYVSPSNWYDYGWLFITWFGHLSRPMSIRDAQLFHHSYYRKMGRHDQYQPSVHRAGTIAYIFEGLVFAGVLAWHLI